MIYSGNQIRIIFHDPERQARIFRGSVWSLEVNENQKVIHIFHGAALYTRFCFSEVKRVDEGGYSDETIN